jgi:hypothetical protein
MDPPNTTAIVCDNWWPVSTIITTNTSPSCNNCANWLPDIEDVANIKSCQNRWPYYILNTPRTVLRPPS